MFQLVEFVQVYGPWVEMMMAVSLLPHSMQASNSALQVGTNEELANKVAEITVLRNRMQQMERENLRLGNELAEAKEKGMQPSQRSREKADLERANEQLQYLRQDLLSSDDERKRLKLTLQSQEQELLVLRQRAEEARPRVPATASADPPAAAPVAVPAAVPVAAVETRPPPAPAAPPAVVPPATVTRSDPQDEAKGRLLLQELARWETLAEEPRDAWCRREPLPQRRRPRRRHGGGQGAARRRTALAAAGGTRGADVAGAVPWSRQTPGKRSLASAILATTPRVAGMTDVLRDVFHAFAGGLEMDGRSFVKCLKDAGLLDERLKTVQADLIFARHKPKGSRRISYDLFIQALTEVAMKRDLLPEEAVDRVCLAHGPDYESSTTAFEDAAAGPERFFYDKTTYTGMHKCSSASQQLVTRPTRSRDLPESWASPEDYDLPKSGPERFYYDRSTYTGTHKNNGPSAAGSGVGKEGYSDLSVLVRRDVVQDDVLQRRRRSKTSNSPNGSGSLPVLLGGHGQTFKPKETKEEPQPQPIANSPEPLKAATQPAAPLAQAQASPSTPMMGARYIHDIPNTFNALSSASLGALGAWPGLGPPAYVPPVMPQMAPMAPMAPASPQMASPQRAPMSAVPQMQQVMGAANHSPAPPASWSPIGSHGYPTMVQRWPAPAAYKAF
eukprot:s1518_g17.t1